MRVLIDGDRVEIGGRKFVPDDGICRLTAEHFEVAKDWPDRWECVLWAFETQASVAEMIAWHRAEKDPPVEKVVEKAVAKKVTLLPVPARKPNQLF